MPRTAKASIKEICKMNDYAILKSIDSKIDSESVERIFNIRKKIISPQN